MELIEENSSEGISSIHYNYRNDPHLEMIIREMERLINLSSYLYYKEIDFIFNVKAFQIDSYYFVFSIGEHELSLSIESREPSKRPLKDSNITREDIIDKLNQIVNGD